MKPLTSSATLRDLDASIAWYKLVPCKSLIIILIKLPMSFKTSWIILYLVANPEFFRLH